MTHQPDPPPDDEPPSPREQMRELARLDTAMAVARRYLAALNAEDHAGCNRILCDLAADRDGLMIPTFMAMTQQCLDLAHVLDQFGLLEGGLQTYLDQSALAQLDVVEADQKVLGEDD